MHPNGHATYNFLEIQKYYCLQTEMNISLTKTCTCQRAQHFEQSMDVQEPYEGEGALENL